MAATAADNEELRNDDDVLGTIEVEPEPPPAEADEDDDDDAQAAPAGNARQRKRERGVAHRELQARTERMETQLQEERLARARMEGLLQENIRRQQPQGPHPLEQQVDEIMRQQEEHFTNFANNAAKMSEAERNAAQERARKLEKDKSLALARLNAAQLGLGQQQHPQQAQQQALRAALDQRYPDIAANDRAAQLGRVIWQQLLIEGKPDNWDTADEAAELTRQRLGMASARQAPRPTAAQRNKFVAAPKGPAVGGGNGGESGPIRITKAQAQMAENAYPTLSSNKAHQKWWNLHGKKHA